MENLNEFKLTEGTYYLPDNQEYFDFIIKKT